jgi:hypothetical protein
MQGFKKSATTNSTLFSGCIPTYATGYFYFSGYFVNTTGGFYRIGKFDIATGAIKESYDGTSSDFGTSVTGFMECAYATKS